MSDQGETHGNNSQTVKDSNSNAPQAKKRKAMAKRSSAWDHFEQFENENKETKARCLHCKKEFHSNSKRNGTTSLLSHLTEVKDLLFSLYEEYKIQIMPDNPNEGSSTVEQRSEMDIDDPTMKVRMLVQNEYKKFKSRVMGARSSKSEVDKYLNEESEEDGAKFDILAWWKVNTPRFPILSHIARDIFAIPISIVASESTFSSGGRVLDAFRSSLNPAIVQSLICAQDWLRKSPTPLNVEENLHKIEDFEKGLQSAS